MPIVLAPFFAFALGALAGVMWMAEGSAEGRRRVIIAWLFFALSYAPNVAYFACVFPDWSAAYLINGARLPSALWLIAAVIASCPFVLAFHWSSRSARVGESRRAVITGAASLVVGIGIGIALASRLWRVGSYAEVREQAELATLGTSWQGFAVLLINTLTLLGGGIAVGEAVGERPQQRVARATRSAERALSRR